MNVFQIYQQVLDRLNILDGLPALLMRLFLAPILIIAGYNKLQLGNPEAGFFEQLTADPNVVAWFGNPDWGLGLPFPTLLANMAAWTEFLGGWFILIGLFTRLASIPLMVTMLVAALSVHIDNGWFAITPTNPDTSAAKFVSWFGFDSAKESLVNSEETGERLSRIREIISENGNTDWLYENGNVVILNNGIEFASTYFIMLLALFFIGGGRFVSVDYYLKDVYRKQLGKTNPLME